MHADLLLPCFYCLLLSTQTHKDVFSALFYLHRPFAGDELRQLCFEWAVHMGYVEDGEGASGRRKSKWGRTANILEPCATEARLLKAALQASWASATVKSSGSNLLRMGSWSSSFGCWCICLELCCLQALLMHKNSSHDTIIYLLLHLVYDLLLARTV